MNELHLFAGSGGGILGGMLLGHTCVCAVEIEPFCRRVLLQRQREGILPRFPIWDDVRTFDGSPWRGIADIVCGGFPCQKFSTASRGRRTAADLSGEMARVVESVEPRFVFAENVSKTAIESLAIQLHQLGYKARALPLSASDLGADHIRERYWLFAHANNEGELLRSINAEVASRTRFRPGIWKTFPSDSRMADGVANRMERYKATGNGQVPIVAATAWRLLMQDTLTAKQN